MASSAEPLARNSGSRGDLGVILTRLRQGVAASVLVALLGPAPANDSIHTTYLWHLHQPIYWPDQRRAGGDDQYESAWDSIQQRDGGAIHPENNLREIFGIDDRVAAYQWRTRDAINSIRGLPDAGAQINYSGSLMENVGSLGFAGQLGYSGGWASAINEARGWLTSGGRPRADMTNFSYHHALGPLHTDRTNFLQIRLHQEKMQQVWGITPGTAPGYFPTEMAFSTRLIPILAQLGIQWSIVSGEHLSRACPDFPVVLGSGGVNCDPPNRADQINPNGVNFWRRSIDRGCSPVHAYPFAYVPHRAQHINPATGAATGIVVVPSDQALSWNDGYSPLGADALSTLDPQIGNAPRPMMVVLAHDGDNAWGGGYSYYQEAVPGFSGGAAARGYSPTTIREYLSDHPVPVDDIVHVEDGAWVNADSDFGSPIFINWLYPLLDANGNIDPAGGWHNKAREYAIFIAAENRIRTAENAQAGGAASTRIAHVMDPGPSTTPVERAWHYYLASMDSGNVYYGNPLDMEIKGTVGCNEAMQHIDPILAGLSPSQDVTEPSIFIPQRHPYNPGSVSFGAQYQYRPFINDGSFTVWTFVSDTGGTQSVTLHYRVDADGQNPLSSTQNETYAGGPEVGAWQSIAMAGRDFPANNVYGWGGLNYFELPAHIARHYSATVPPQLESLVDYYVEAVDARGNVARSPIQHVYVGDGQGGTPGGSRVTTAPAPPVRGQSATISFENEGGPLASASQVRIHYGFDNWQTVHPADPPMTFNSGTGRWEITLPMPADRSQFDCVFNNGAGTWDNNGGQDWHFTLASIGTPTGHAFLSPNPAVATQPATLSYEVASGPLSQEATIRAHITYNGGAITVTPDPVMTFDAPSGQWRTSVTVPATATSMRAAFNNGASLVDDRNGNPWSWTVLPPPTGTPALAPNPPIAGQSLFITYAPGAGPLAAAATVRAGVEFTPAAGDTAAQAFTDHPMSLNGGTGLWEVTLPVPAGATQMTLRFNDGGALTDDNNGAGWIYTVSAGAAGETVTLTPNPPVAGESVTISYEDQGRPLAGAATVKLHHGFNNWSTVIAPDPSMTFNAGTGRWEITVPVPPAATQLDFVFNNGANLWDNNGQQDWHFPVTGTPPPTGGTIIIGSGAPLGTTAGQTWNQEFQDWHSADVRALDEPDDTYDFGDGQDSSRDIIAFYHRDDAGAGKVFFRVDLFDLALGAENGSLDVYVAIDFNSPSVGQEFLPDFTDCRTDTRWEVCINLYDATNYRVYDSSFNLISTNIAPAVSPALFLGSHWRSDLDSVEFGIDRAVLTAEGWDGSSPLSFQVFTTRDGTNGGAGEIPGHSDLTDAIVDDDRGYSDGTGDIGLLNGATPSTAQVTPLPFAYILHGNQSLNEASGVQELVHSSTVQTPAGNPTGYHRALETAQIFQAPPSIHVSATLGATLQWADRPGTSDPQDGPQFNARIAQFLDGNAANGEGALIAGVFSEHIMPYFEGATNQLSIGLNEQILEDLYGEVIDPGQHVFWVPERVIRGSTFADLAGTGYEFTVLDQQSHILNWYGQAEADAHGHRIHRINGVNCFLINNETDGRKFFPQDDGLNFELRTSFINRALSADDEQLVLAFDDWEAYAGRSFTSFGTGNPNPDNWNRTVRWLANHQWIEMTTLEDIAGRGWTPVSHPVNTGLPLQTYDWLRHATHENYDNWYNGQSGLEESFRDYHPDIRTDLAQFAQGIVGAVNQPGTLYGDIASSLGGLPGNGLADLARLGWCAAIFETAWHDENEPLESGNPDNTYDQIAFWAKRLNVLLARRIGFAIAAAQWAASSPSTFTGIQQADLDHDGENEYVLSNNRVWCVFENDGGRLIAAFVRDPATGTAAQAAGATMANPDSEDEREGADNSGARRTSCLKDWWAAGPNTGQYVNDVYSVTVPLASTLRFTSSDGRIVKEVTLPDDSDTLEVSYQLQAPITTLYVRMGLSPNVADLMVNGQENLSVTNTGGVLSVVNDGAPLPVTTAIHYADAGHTAAHSALASDGSANSPRNHALTHMVEISGSGAFTFGLRLAIGSGTPSDQRHGLMVR